MTGAARIIRIAAALIDDGAGRLLLVRKTGTRWFMQAGGKIEGRESPLAALRRELREEIGIDVAIYEPRALGGFRAPAANEPDHEVDAALFHLRVDCPPVIAAEIEEARWLTPEEAAGLPLAPLTRDHVLPLAIRLWAR